MSTNTRILPGIRRRASALRSSLHRLVFIAFARCQRALLRNTPDGLVRLLTSDAVHAALIGQFHKHLITKTGPLLEAAMSLITLNFGG